MEKKIVIKVPDIGSYDNVDVIDISVKEGDKVKIDDTLITLETDKASMDIPSTAEGDITKIFVKIGDKVSQGNSIVEILSVNNDMDKTNDNISTIDEKSNNLELNDFEDVNSEVSDNYILDQEVNKDLPLVEGSINNIYDIDDKLIIHAGPAVRKFARELGVNLKYITGSGKRNRIVIQDVKDYVKTNFGKVSNSSIKPFGNLDLLTLPVIDFSKYGYIEKRKLSKIQKLSSMNLYRNWITIPHVTQHIDADFTSSEEFRIILNKEWEKDNLKCSPLVLIIKAVTYALKEFPEFNSSLVEDEIILKKYYNIGFAADTPNGLVVPVIMDTDKKGLKEIAFELKELSLKARLNKLSIISMKGSTFTISSLGGIGGNYFTPIINAPEVAILGVCKNEIKPVYNGKEFVARLKCPLSLSYDHRVIDGALACRFIKYLSDLLSDIRKILV